MDYQTWVQRLRSYQRPCGNGQFCETQNCKYTHSKYIPDKKQYLHKREFYKLLSEQDALHQKYKFNWYEQYRNGIDKTTKDYQEAEKRYKFLRHLFQVHKQEQYNISCSQLGHEQCKKLGYYKEEQDPKYIEKTRKIKKMQKMRSDNSFMDHLVSFGKYKDKSWRHVQKYNPGYIDWIINNLEEDKKQRDIALIIVQKRK